MLHLFLAHGASDVKFPEPEPDGDWIALAIVLVVLAAFAIWVLIKKSKKTPEVTEAISVCEPAEAPKAPGSAGKLKLYNVEPKTAAMIMAIVADQMGKPLNELRFISIKEVE